MKTLRTYTAYGQRLVCDLDLEPWLPGGGAHGSALEVREAPAATSTEELSVETGLHSTHGRALKLASNLPLDYSRPGQLWRFEVGDVARFEWRGGTALIEYRPGPEAKPVLLAFWLLHIFLPLFFTLEGRYEFIHASALEVGGRALLLLAPSHGGKSTLTDFFLHRGHALIADDKVGTFFEGGAPMAVPSHPSHRPYRNHEDLGQRAPRFAAVPLPIGEIFVLQRVAPDEPVALRRLTGHQQFAHMLPSSLFRFDFMNARRMAAYARIAAVVRARRVEVPWDLERLGEVYVALLEAAGR